MDNLDLAKIKEALTILVSFLTPIFMYFAGRFFLTKQELRKKEAEADIAEGLVKEKEADILIIYEGIIKRASEDAIAKSDRWLKLESEWNERFRGMDERLSKQNAEISVLRNENGSLSKTVDILNQDRIRMESSIRTLQQEKSVLEFENSNLKMRVANLERELAETRKKTDTEFGE